jgi:CHAT domain-containing protein
VLEVAYHVTRNVRSSCGGLEEIAVSPLPGTKSEVEEIVLRWEESTGEASVACFGGEASEDRFKAEAPNNRVIHLATHGYYLEGACRPDRRERVPGSDMGFVEENPLLLSGLFFAGANLHGEGADSFGAEDGILTAYEVSAMDLKGTELVVLSACETGLGRVEEGEGVYGLRRAFQMAGARTVISALWPVSDEATADMMSRLYERKGESIPETMRRIQLSRINELRQAGRPDHPFTWGGFIALGDWR